MITSIDDIDKQNIESDFLREYVAFKEQNPDSVIMIQLGTFFETYFEDAEILSHNANVTLSSRSFKGIGSVAQAGIPENVIEFYVKLLVSKNFKVCVCPQYCSNDNKVYRKIVRKYTKGTIIENEFLESGENNYILALYKDNDLIKLAYADVSTGQFYKTSNASYQLIQNEVDKISPSEILILNDQTDYFKNISNKYNVSILNSPVEKDIEPENIIKNYCKVVQKTYAVELDNIVEYKVNDYLSMDEITRRDLELTRTKRLLKKKGSLFWFLNYTKTPMGARLLKKYMDEPLLVKELILKRQSAVLELIEDKNRLSELDYILSELCDLSRISAKISNTTILPKDLYVIVENLNKIKVLKNLISKYSSPILKINSKNYTRVLELSRLIEQSIKIDADSEIKHGDIIKEGYDSSLELLRQKKSDLLNKLLKYEKKQKKRLGIEKLKISYSKAIGYFIEIPMNKASSVPLEYFKKHSTLALVRYSTSELSELEKDLDEIQFKINELEFELFSKIRRQAVVFVEVVRSLAFDIARLDVMVSFAKCAVENNLCCPKFSEKGIFIKNGFHPSLLKLNNALVKNDTLLENGNLFIITGTNMSGKSTYLKHNAIIVLLAQIGAFVPADSSCITITDKIFFRQGANDDLINNNSSFMVEMNDLKYILDNATSNSLVLLDEPAKSTASIEGGAIARAYLEYFINSIKAKIMVVTHNFELTKIEDSFPNICQNWQIGFSEENPERKLKRGISKSSNALNTAKLANLPLPIIKKAQEYILKS